jgi:glycosyltransferase involved in cell wall biosynthesis
LLGLPHPGQDGIQGGFKGLARRDLGKHDPITLHLGLNTQDEIILVDDACPQGSGTLAEQLASTDATVRVVRLTTNVGQHRAALFGISHARGEKIVLIDADLQDPPAAIGALVRSLEDGCDAVFARSESRAESFRREITSRLFKAVVNPLYGIPPSIGMFMAITSRMRDVLLAYRTRHVYLPGMIGLSGLPHRTIAVPRVSRPVGRSAYTAWTRLRFAWHVILCRAECPTASRRRRIASEKLAGQTLRRSGCP